MAAHGLETSGSRNTDERAFTLDSMNKIGKDELPDKIAPIAGPPALGDLITLSVIEELHVRRVIANTFSLQRTADVPGMDRQRFGGGGNHAASDPPKDVPPCKTVRSTPAISFIFKPRPPLFADNRLKYH